MKLTLYVEVVRQPQFMYSGGTLYARVIETGQVPDPIDDVELFPPEDPDDGPGGGPLWKSKRRYMDVDGNWHLELSRIWVDPVPGLMNTLGPGDHYAHPWWTSIDGDPEPGLRRVWRLYQEIRRSVHVTKLCDCGGHVQANFCRGDLISVEIHHQGYGDHRRIEQLNIAQWYGGKIERPGITRSMAHTSVTPPTKPRIDPRRDRTASGRRRA